MACSFDPVTPERRQKRQWANIQGEHSPKLQEMKVISQHGFRAARRAAARDRQQRSIEKLEARVKELQNTRVQYITVEKEVVKVHEKVVEVLVEKIVEVPVNNETIVEKSIQVPDKMSRFTEEDITAAFIKGTETAKEDVKRAFDLGTKLATEEKEKITGMLMERMEEMKKTYKNDLTEAKLRKEPSDSDSKEREMKLKEMLKTQMHTNMELKTKLSKAEDVVKHMESEVMHLRAKIKSYEDILQKEAEETAKQKELSLMCGTEVPRDAVVLIQQRFEKEGITWDTENLQALFDCDVLQVFKEAFANFQAALESAVTGGVRSSSSSVEEDSGDESESGSYEEEYFKQFERENM